jgi:Bifunctional DNA primase/polymerase, N-terminal
MTPAWLKDARDSGRPVFPLALTKAAGGTKWLKEGYRPGWERLTVDAAERLWNTPFGQAANGCGIAMGGDVYLVDLDLHKGDRADIAEVVREWGLPETRVHATPSGGAHLFYRLPPGEPDLPNTNNLGVPGIDTRGQGGNAAFGAPYRVQRRVAWADLPTVPAALVAAVRARAALGAGLTGPVPMPEPLDVDMLEDLLPFRLTAPAARRWGGDTTGLADLSWSARDMSMAKLLAYCGLSYSEVYALLRLRFRFGVAHNHADKPNLEHELRRTAWRAVERAREEKKAAMEDAARLAALAKALPSPEDQRAALDAIMGGEQ